MTDYTIGVDISKARLDAYRLPGGDTQCFSNDRQGFRARLKWIGKGQIERIV